MQSLKNKLHLNKNSTTSNSTTDKKHHLFGGRHATNNTTHTTTTTSAPSTAVRETEAIASTLPHGSTVERTETERTTFVDDHVHAPVRTSSTTDITVTEHIPTAPMAPAVWSPIMDSSYQSGWTSEWNDRWNSDSFDFFNNYSWNRGLGWRQLNRTSGLSSSSFGSSSSFEGAVVRENLPVQIMEKPLVIHEEIRREQVEEIQPVINIEKLQTEVHQVTQPLFDKEVKAVNIQQRTLDTKVLPEVLLPGRGIAAEADRSTLVVQDTAAIVIEKPALVSEIDKLQIIEEIQPVLYKETVVPTVIQETQHVYQKIVEGPVYVQEIRAPLELHNSQFKSLHTSTWTDASLSRTGSVPVSSAPMMMGKTFDSTPSKVIETTETTRTTTSSNVPNLPTYAM